jgi:hydroxyethylthiazole kinase-like uncharacterized protein yjeF
MSLQRLDNSRACKLLDIACTRLVEQRLVSLLPEPTLMERAGTALGQLALALAPHAEKIWIACGPGNNGGDGWQAACFLHHAGMNVLVSCVAGHKDLPQDAQTARQKAMSLGIQISEPPLDLGPQDLILDCLLGTGTGRAVTGAMAHWVEVINKSPALVVSADMPTGLNADTGEAHADARGEKGSLVRADHTLMLLTAKPGAFMAQGRDATGQLWLDDLTRNEPEKTVIAGFPAHVELNPQPTRTLRQHNSHKGSYGDVAIVGGESISSRGMGMTGAAVLAAMSALQGGSGRVLLSLLASEKNTAQPDMALYHPELMQRHFAALDLQKLTVVCGCGGGMAVGRVVAEVLQRSRSLVLDADALNAIAQDTVLAALLKQRSARSMPTVLTPHPLEAARLLGCSTAQIQSHRVASAVQLAALFACTVALKGSGTVIACPNQVSRINPTGNAQLATAGTGDVLAGLIGAKLAQGLSAFVAASQAVFQHGQVADDWQFETRLTASRLARRLN